MNGDVADRSLAEKGRIRIEWADGQMPVLRAIRERFAKEKPLSGYKVAACLHVTSETANLMRTLVAGGAQVALCASNPLSTQDDIAAALDVEGIATFAIKGEDDDTYYRHIMAAIDFGPQITMDDGADVVSTLHSKRTDAIENILAGTEETTTGVNRLRQMAAEGVLRYPIVAVNDTPTKHMFDNRYGTGQSTLDGITRATNILWASRAVVICGYGFGGKGLAMRARGLGGQVIVTEVDPVKALEAVMDGFRVMPIADAAREGDVFITVTGDRDVIRREHIELMKDGAILANTGHFDVEIDKAALAALAAEPPRTMREYVQEFRLADGRRVYLLAEGRLVNLAAAEGHPATVMDMSFADQALTAEWLVANGAGLERRVYEVPPEIDADVARVKLATLGLRIDELTPEQRAYLSSWREGT
ncbi:MAG: adenosylhomocysteinase [Actinomycetota bacterium]